MMAMNIRLPELFMVALLARLLQSGSLPNLKALLGAES
jgi:hypothetical protein